VLHNIRLERLTRDKDTSLLGQLVSFEENEMLRIWPQGSV
jgi:hypothetical protein